MCTARKLIHPAFPYGRLVVAIAAALLFRLVVIWLADGAAISSWASPDTSEIWTSRAVAQGIRSLVGLSPLDVGIRSDLALHPTGYAVILGPFMAAFGTSMIAVKVFQAVLDGVLAVALVYFLTRRFLGPGPALWAAWLYALSPPVAVNQINVVNSTPSGLLAMAVLAAAVKAAGEGGRRWGWVLLAAILAGLLTATDNKFLLYPLAVTAVLAWLLRSQGKGRGPVLAGVVVVMLAGSWATTSATRALLPAVATPSGAESNLLSAVAGGIGRVTPNKWFATSDPPIIPEADWVAIAGVPYADTPANRAILNMEIRHRLPQVLAERPDLYLRSVLANLSTTLAPRNTWTPQHLGPWLNWFVERGLVPVLRVLQALPTLFLFLGYGGGLVLLAWRRRWQAMVVLTLPMMYLAGVLSPLFSHARYVGACYLTFSAVAAFAYWTLAARFTPQRRDEG